MELVRLEGLYLLQTGNMKRAITALNLFLDGNPNHIHANDFRTIIAFEEKRSLAWNQRLVDRLHLVGQIF